jgi:hypothetical protein
VALSQRQINIFSKEVTSVPVWRRRPTVCEWYSLWAIPGLLLYPVNCAYLWSLGGRWEGSRLGETAAPLVLIIIEVVLAINWTMKWGVQSFHTEPKAGSKFERKQLMGNLLWTFNSEWTFNSGRFQFRPHQNCLIAPELNRQFRGK